MSPSETASGMLALAQRQVDRVIPPQTRARVLDQVKKFTAERPLLSAFIVAQVLTSIVPIAVFLAFTSSVLALSLGAAILFSLFWLGVALVFVVPALFVTVSLGFIVFAWAVAARFAWNALPAGIRASVTPGKTKSSKHKGQNGYHDEHKKEVNGRNGHVHA